jgi:lipopolysaccharide export system protein LptA
MKLRQLFIAVVAATSSVAGVAQEKPQQVRIRAERTEQTAPGVVKASGTVVASIGLLTIRADVVEVSADSDRKTTLVIAEGRVVLERGDERLQLRRLQLDTGTGRGTFELAQP